MENNLLKILEKPESSSIEEIKDAITTNPWLSILRMIWLYRIQREKQDIFSEELKKHIPFIRDRKQLHRLITSKSWEEFHIQISDSLKLDLVNFHDNSKIPAEELLEIEKEEIIDDQTEIDETVNGQKQPSVNQDKTYPENNLSAVVPETEKSEQKEKDLIERFLELDPGPIRADKETRLIGDISTESTKESEEFITDTLAKIYVKQGLYSKAIFAYEKLSLKYPEKSIYFASQIEEIKKRIDN